MTNNLYDKNNVKFRNRVDVRLVTKSKDYQKLVSRPSFVLQKMFNKNLSAVHKIKEVL